MGAHLITPLSPHPWGVCTCTSMHTCEDGNVVKKDGTHHKNTIHDLQEQIPNNIIFGGREHGRLHYVVARENSESVGPILYLTSPVHTVLLMEYTQHAMEDQTNR